MARLRKVKGVELRMENVYSLLCLAGGGGGGTQCLLNVYFLECSRQVGIVYRNSLRSSGIASPRIFWVLGGIHIFFPMESEVCRHGR